MPQREGRSGNYEIADIAMALEDPSVVSAPDPAFKAFVIVLDGHLDTPGLVDAVGTL